MAPASKTLSIWRGNTETFGFRLKQANGQPVDLTGAVLVLTIVHECGRVVKSSGEGGIVIDEPETGAANCTLTPTETRAIPASKVRPARYELELKTADEQRTLLIGNVKVAGGDNDD